MKKVRRNRHALLSLMSDIRFAIGNWKGNPPLPPLSLEDSEEHLEGMDKLAFLSFMRSMLTWLPEKRKSARKQLMDPWLNH